MKVLTHDEIQNVSGAGILANEFANAGLGFGSAADSALNNGTLAQIGNGVGFGIGSVADGFLGVSENVGQFNVNAANQLGPSFIAAGGSAAANVVSAGIGAIGSAVGNAVGGIIGALNPLKLI